MELTLAVTPSSFELCHTIGKAIGVLKKTLKS